jgi:hypothetical protein
MPTTYKILGSAAPSTAGATLYTVPTTGNAVISTVSVANITTGSRTFKLILKPTAATTLANNHYLANDSIVPANDTIVLTLGITMSGSNVLIGSGSTSDIAFNVFGSEIT